ncbi:MAG: thiol-disulfide isomerase/thioredoxin [Flavobacteriaceae bacterium]|jgi:thiol-disulfide isomerase/thioredoxin|uniref:TlpA disulfide reductase family protein n=1 Tax=Candidatus Marifrigoribacter sp. Uisw_064 TaxID=3230970 RepID=UPI003AE55C63
MNKISLLLLLVLFQSCINSSSETSQEKNDIGANETITAQESSSEIPSLNFSELEPYFNKKNDTTYVINFWATWCKPCIKELPYFEKITETYANQKVKVVLVSLDFPKKLQSTLIPFVKKRGLKSEVILLNDDDVNTWIPKVSDEWEGAIPATLIYKNEHRNFFERSFTFEELDTEILNILNQ